MKNLFKCDYFSSFFMLPTIIYFSHQTDKYFDRAIFVLFENTDNQEALQQPFFKQISKQRALFTNFDVVTHPSQGNYVGI